MVVGYLYELIACWRTEARGTACHHHLQYLEELPALSGPGSMALLQNRILELVYKAEVGFSKDSLT